MTGKWNMTRLAADPILERTQQECRQVRMIRWFAVGFAGAARRLGAAE
jgi:hypothetical protein